MTAKQLRRLRGKLGITQGALAQLLYIESRSAGRTIRRWEAGDITIPGPVCRALEAIAKDAGIKI